MWLASSSLLGVDMTEEIVTHKGKMGLVGDAPPRVGVHLRFLKRLKMWAK